jgi:uncharacterized protein (TIGR04255 family)
VSFGVELKSDASAPAALLHPAPERVQFRRSDESALLQVGPGLLVVNQLRPYPGWEHFRALILDTCAHHQQLGDLGRLTRVGLRYINRLDPSEEHFTIGDYLTLDPPLPPSLDRPLRSFHQRYEIDIASPTGLLIHQTGIVTTGLRSHLMLDLDFVSETPPPLSARDELSHWLDAAHEQVEIAFLASLGPASRRLLGTDEA